MRKRSKYRPKGIRMDTIKYVVSGLAPVLSHSASTSMRIANHSALTALTQGRAERSDIDALIAAFNMAEALSLVNPELGSEWAQEIRGGQDALYDVALRGVKTGKFVLTGPEMAAMNLAMDVHEAQLAQAAVLELERAIDLIEKRIRAKQARRLPTKPPQES